MIITKDILNDKVPSDMLPTRLDSALNLYINIKTKEETGIIVYNTNPSTWNCLYPFYELNHKFTLNNYTCKKDDITYGELIEEYNKIYKKIYEKEQGYVKDIRIKTLIDEYKKTFNLKSVNISAELSPIYELKYSKSQNVWTLYYFENYVVDKVNDINILLSQDLYEQKILKLDSSIEEVGGTPLTTNIPYILSVESNIEILNTNLIIIE